MAEDRELQRQMFLAALERLRGAPDDRPTLSDLLKDMDSGLRLGDLAGPPAPPGTLASLRDAFGAYRPTRDPESMTLGEIVREMGAPLSPDKKVNPEYVFRWLRTHSAGSLDCQVCGHNEWVVAENLVQPMDYVVGAKNEPAITWTLPRYPLVMIICNNCGYTFFLNAVRIGVLPAPGADHVK